MKIRTLLLIFIILTLNIVSSTNEEFKNTLTSSASYFLGDINELEETAIEVSSEFAKENDDLEAKEVFFPMESNFIPSVDIAFPVTSHIVTSHYGERIHPVTGLFDFHKGVDLVSNDSLEVFAIDNSYVIENSYDETLGNYIVLDHGNGYESLYAHLESTYLKDNFKKGEVIGIMGSSGLSTGVHLHLEITKDGEHFDPLDYLYAN